MPCKEHGAVCDEITALDGAIDEAAGSPDLNEDLIAFLQEADLWEAYSEPDRTTIAQREAVRDGLLRYARERGIPTPSATDDRTQP